MRARLLVVVAALTLASSLTVAAQTQRRFAVVEITNRAPAAGGRIVLTLVSGATITVAAADIEETLSIIANDAFKTKLPAAAPPAQPVADQGQQSAAEILGIISAKCSKQWPTDFQLRAYCEKQQRESIDTLIARPMTSRDQITIRVTCRKQWQEDFQMRNYCEEQQLKALTQLLPR